MMGSIKKYEEYAQEKWEIATRRMGKCNKNNERLQQEEWKNATRRMSAYKNKTEEI
jgi:hypothetical protein